MQRLSIIATFAFVLASCSSDDDPAASATGADTGTDAVTEDAGSETDTSATADTDGTSGPDIEVPEDVFDAPDAGDEDAEGGDTGEPDSGTDGGPDVVMPTEAPRVRSCSSVFTYPATGATTVELAGEWDWTTPEPMTVVDGEWRLEKTLPAGVHCYKFIVDGGGEWLLDPSNRYEKYCDGGRNSGKRVPDCQQPLIELTDFQQSGDSATVNFTVWAGADGALVEVPVIEGAEVDFDSEWHGTATWTGLENGKHTGRIVVTDTGGRTTDVLVPFWVEDEPFEWRDAMMYLVMTDRFVNGDTSNDPLPNVGVPPSADWMGGDFAGLLSRIEDGYLNSMGVRAIWITPPMENPPDAEIDKDFGSAGYHGYWPIEAREVDPRMGTADELKAVIQAAHDRGIRVLMDFVANHVHDQHQYFIEHPEWFNDGCKCGDPGCGWTEQALTCLFQPYMPDLDWTNFEAAEQMVEDALWWMEEFDLDGLRVDAVKHVPEHAVFNLAMRVNERFETGGQDVYLLGETAVGWAGDNLEDNASEYGLVNKYMNEDGLDGQFDFVIYHAAVNNVFFWDQKGYIHLDYWTGQSLEQYVEGSVMVPYLGSHDKSRAISIADYRGQDAAHPTGTAYARWPEDGLPEQPGEDEPYERVRTGFCWLLTSPGLPLIYMSDEYGEYGGADPDNRHMHRMGEQLSEREQGLLEAVQTLGTTRQALPALRRGDYQGLDSTESMAIYTRTTDTGEMAVVFVNGAETPATVTRSVTTSCTENCWTEMLGFGATATGDGTSITATIPPRSCGVFVP